MSKGKNRYDVTAIIDRQGQRTTIKDSVRANTALGAKQKVGHRYNVREYKKVKRN